jgi:hypothetical protein
MQIKVINILNAIVCRQICRWQVCCHCKKTKVKRFIIKKKLRARERKRKTHFIQVGKKEE